MSRTDRLISWLCCDKIKLMNPKHYQAHLITLQANPELLDSETTIADCIDTLIAQGGFTKLEYTSHQFSPQGITAVALLSESHIAIHTWPESGTAKIVIATCQEAALPIRELGDMLLAKLHGNEITYGVLA